MGVTTNGNPADEAARAFARAVGTIVAELRSKYGWSLEDLADESGRHRTYLGLVERGERHLSIAAAYRIAHALGISLSTLIELAETGTQGINRTVRFERRVLMPGSARRGDAVKEIAGLDKDWIPRAIEAIYRTLDLIDEQLINTGSPPLAEVVELANLSAVIGNLIRTTLARHSNGRYEGNEPHKYPDLVSKSKESNDLEIKIALETNMPKNHLPKPGMHLICRYVLASRNGPYSRGIRGDVAWIWEVRLGELTIEDFSISNAAGDSGKTAVIKAAALDRLSRIYYDDRFLPYANPRSGHI